MSENYIQIKMLHELGSFNPWISRVALRRARQLSPSNQLLLLRTWNRRYRRAYLFRCALILGSGALYSIVLLWWHTSLATNRSLQLGAFLGFFLPILCALIPLPSHRGLIVLLRGTKDLIFVDLGLTLLSEAHIENSVAVIRETIVRLLPHVPLRQAARWTDGQRLALIQMVPCRSRLPLKSGVWQPLRRFVQRLLAPQSIRPRLTGEDVRQALIVLKFLERAGDDRELPLLQEIVGWDAKTKKEKLIQEAATQCLFCLAHKVRATTPSSTSRLGAVAAKSQRAS